jgi:hypothetical protein
MSKASNEPNANISIDNGQSFCSVSDLSDEEVERVLAVVETVDAQHMAKMAADGCESPRRYLEVFCRAFEREEAHPFQIG